MSQNKKISLEDIDFDKYIFDKEKGIWSKNLKKWLTGHVHYDKKRNRYDLTIRLTDKNGKHRIYQYARVMSYLFVERAKDFANMPYELLEVDHIDGNSMNNVVTNYKWTNREGNMNNPVTKERISETMKGENNPMYGKPRPEKGGRAKIPIEQWSYDGTIFIKKYNSLTEAQKETGANYNNIRKCLNGIIEHCGGFKWKYAKK